MLSMILRACALSGTSCRCLFLVRSGGNAQTSPVISERRMPTTSPIRCPVSKASLTAAPVRPPIASHASHSCLISSGSLRTRSRALSALGGFVPATGDASCKFMQRIGCRLAGCCQCRRGIERELLRCAAIPVPDGPGFPARRLHDKVEPATAGVRDLAARSTRLDVLDGFRCELGHVRYPDCSEGNENGCLPLLPRVGDTRRQ